MSTIPASGRVNEGVRSRTRGAAGYTIGRQRVSRPREMHRRALAAGEDLLLRSRQGRQCRTFLTFSGIATAALVSSDAIGAYVLGLPLMASGPASRLPPRHEFGDRFAEVFP
ncbi:hypothetical protein ACWD25_34420 [Streptomyces sp. NPDC002920]